jgi:formylglycine-generating enzyme required for sulfatase activity
MLRRPLLSLSVLLSLASDGCATDEAAAGSPAPASASAAPAAASAASAKSPAAAYTGPGAPPSPCPCSSLERCDEATGHCVPSCPKGEVFVPATGSKGFTLGNGVRGDMYDVPHHVVLTKPFCIDATEVTVRAYKACVDAGACTEPRRWGEWTTYDAFPDHPVNKVDWKQAVAYCKKRGQALPTEAQWEWAATQGDGRLWPWGNDKPDCERTDYSEGVIKSPASDDGCHGGGPSPVGTHPKGAVVWPSGRIHDMSGNVWEWCADGWGRWPDSPQIDPMHEFEPWGPRVIRGGGWNRSARGIEAHYRGAAVQDYRVPGLGFRCARNPS